MKFQTKAEADAAAKMETMRTGYEHKSAVTFYLSLETFEKIPCWTLVLTRRKVKK